MSQGGRSNLINFDDNGLASAVNDIQTTIEVTSSTDLPTVPFYLVIDPFNIEAYEVLYCTFVAGTTLTVVRNLEGTKGTTHSALVNGSPNIVRFAYAKQQLDDLWDAFDTVLEVVDPFVYTFDDGTTAAIVAGEWALDTTFPSTATEFFIHETDDQGENRSVGLEALRENDVISFKAVGSDARAAVNLSGPGVLASNVYTFPINSGAESGAAFVDGEDTIIGTALGRNLALGQLSDVEVDGVEDLQVLGFQLSTGTWIPITQTANKGITTLSYLYDANQDATPPAGDVSPNNATPSLTTSIAISNTDAVGDDISFVLANLKAGDLLVIQQKADGANREDYVIVSNTDQGTFRDIVVTFDSAAGTINDNDPVFVHTLAVLPDLDAVYLRLDTTNDPLTGALNLGSNQLTSIADGTLDTDGVSKLQTEVDAQARAVAQAILRMQWRNVWAPGTYEEFDTVTDQSFTMVANKQTSDRAAPQPQGNASFLLPDDGSNWDGTNPTFVGLVTSANRYTFAVFGVLSAFRVFIPSGSDGTITYRVYIADRTDPANIITTLGDEFQTTVTDDWITVNLAGGSFGVGSIVEVGLLSFNSATGSDDTFPWDSVGDSNVENDPGIGNVETNGSDEILRLSDTDSDLGDQTALLATIIPGSFITVSTQANPASFTTYQVASNTDFVSYRSFGVQVFNSGLGGHTRGVACNVRIQVPVPQVTEYVESTAGWSTIPFGFSAVEGVLVEGGGAPVISANAYGTDIEVQAYLASPDWDLLALSGGGGSGGGGGGPAPNGLPAGGTAGQQLTKVDSEDFNSAWTDESFLHDDLTDVSPDQHHTRYTDAEADARAALQDHDHDTPIAVHDALPETHHTKYTDAEALAQAQTLDHDHATPIAAAISAHEADAGDPHAAAGYLKQSETDALYLALTGGLMTGEIDMGSDKIVNVLDPTSNQDAATKKYVDDRDALFLPLGGGTLTGFLTLHADPTAVLHAASKQYVDAGDTAGYQDPLTTIGDIVRFNLATERLAIGSALDVLTVVGGLPVWQAPVTGVTNHDQLGNVLTSQHHVRYDDAEAVSANTGIWLSVGGGTLTGLLTLSAGPTIDLHAATKKYVDDEVASVPGFSGDHADLTNVTTSQHHVKYTDAEADARAALQDHDHDTPIGVHAALPSTHHARYDDAEAIAAVGPHTTLHSDLTSGSDDHHTRYTDGEAVIATTDHFTQVNAPTSPTIGTVWVNPDDPPEGIYVQLIGDTMTGLLILSADPTAALGAATKQYVDGLTFARYTDAEAIAAVDNGTYLKLTGGAMTGDIDMGTADFQFTTNLRFSSTSLNLEITDDKIVVHNSPGSGNGTGDLGLFVEDAGGGVGNGGMIGVKALQGKPFQWMKGFLTDGGSNSRGRLRFFYRAVNSDAEGTRSAQVTESGKWEFIQNIGDGTSLRAAKENIEDATWIADLPLVPVSFHHLVNERDEFGFVAEDLNDVDERLGELDVEGDLVNYSLRGIVAILAAKVNRLEALNG